MRIDHGAILGTGSAVTADMPDDGIVRGTPVRLFRSFLFIAWHTIHRLPYGCGCGDEYGYSGAPGHRRATMGPPRLRDARRTHKETTVLSTVARTVVPVLGRLRVTSDPGAELAPGSIVAANHTSLVDPGVVLAALHRLGADEPVVLATAGLWRIPGLRHALVREGHIPVHRGTCRAAASLEAAAGALAAGRIVLVYGEGGLPRRSDAGEAAPGPFRSGLARLALATGAPVVPLGQAGSRRISSGSAAKQVAGFVTAPLRRPGVHVHVGAPLRLSGDVVTATARVRRAVVDAWRTAAERAGHLSAGPAAAPDLDTAA